MISLLIVWANRHLVCLHFAGAIYILRFVCAFQSKLRVKRSEGFFLIQIKICLFCLVLSVELVNESFIKSITERDRDDEEEEEERRNLNYVLVH